MSVRRAAFWAITLVGPLLVTALVAELALRACRARQAPTDSASLSRRLEDSAKAKFAS